MKLLVLLLLSTVSWAQGTGVIFFQTASGTTSSLPQAAAPTFAPDGSAGPFTSTQSVTINDSTTGATKTYCTSTATCTPSTTYSTPVSISTSGTYLCAYATASGYSQSTTYCSQYIINVPSGPAYVQDVSCFKAGTTSTCPITVQNASSTILVSTYVNSSTGYVSGVADGATNLALLKEQASSQSYKVEAWCYQPGTAGSHTLTVTATVSGSNVYITDMEFTGIGSCTPDGTPGGGAGTGTAITASTTTTQTPDLMFVAIPPGTYTSWGSGANAYTPATSGPTSGHPIAAYLVTTGAGAQTVNITASSGIFWAVTLTGLH